MTIYSVSSGRALMERTLRDVQIVTSAAAKITPAAGAFDADSITAGSAFQQAGQKRGAARTGCSHRKRSRQLLLTAQPCGGIDDAAEIRQRQCLAFRRIDCAALCGAPAGEQCGKGTVEFFFAVDNGADTRGHVIREDRAVRTSVDGRAENAGNGFAVPAGGTDGGSASRGGQFPRDSGQAFAGVGVVGEYLCGGGCILIGCKRGKDRVRRSGFCRTESRRAPGLRARRRNVPGHSSSCL